MTHVKQFELRVAKRTGLPSEIASALWEKGVHIQAFSADLLQGQDIFHLAVDKTAVAEQTFIENGWRAAEEGELDVGTAIGRDQVFSRKTRTIRM